MYRYVMTQLPSQPRAYLAAVNFLRRCPWLSLPSPSVSEDGEAQCASLVDGLGLRLLPPLAVLLAWLQQLQLPNVALVLWQPP